MAARGAATASSTPEQGAVVQQAGLVDLARRHGYRLDELIKIIEDVG